MSQKVCIDAGFGNVKFITPSGTTGKYPAKYALYQKPKYISELGAGGSSSQSNQPGHADPVAIYFDSLESTKNLVLSWLDTQYFIGESAIIHGTPIQTVTKNRMVSTEGRVHIMAALALALPEGAHSNVDVMVGLPVDEYNELKDEYLKIVSGQHDINLLDLNGVPWKWINAKIARAKVLPQPMGAVFANLITPDGTLRDTRLAQSILGVIDLGYRTEDLCQMDSLNFKSQYSKSNPKLGCYGLFVALAEIMRRRGVLDREPEYYEANWGKGELLLGGTPVAIGEYKREAFELTLTAIISDIQTTWPNIREMAMIIISGGGAYIFGEAIKRSLMAMYKIREEVFMIPEESEFLNVRGYRRHADYIWRD